MRARDAVAQLPGDLHRADGRDVARVLERDLKVLDGADGGVAEVDLLLLERAGGLLQHAGDGELEVGLGARHVGVQLGRVRHAVLRRPRDEHRGAAVGLDRALLGRDAEGRARRPDKVHGRVARVRERDLLVDRRLEGVGVEGQLQVRHVEVEADRHDLGRDLEREHVRVVDRVLHDAAVVLHLLVAVEAHVEAALRLGRHDLRRRPARDLGRHFVRQRDEHGVVQAVGHAKVAHGRRPDADAAEVEECCGRRHLRELGGREPRGAVAHLGLGRRPGLELLLHELVGVERRRGGALPAAALLDPERLREAVGQRRRRRLLEGVEGQVHTLGIPRVPPRERGRAQGRVAVDAALALLRAVS